MEQKHCHESYACEVCENTKLISKVFYSVLPQVKGYHMMVLIWRICLHVVEGSRTNEYMTRNRSSCPNVKLNASFQTFHDDIILTVQVAVMTVVILPVSQTLPF